MGGLFLDIWIVYLSRLLLRLWRSWGSSTWKKLEAKVDSSLVLKGSGFWDCTTVEIAYSYNFEDQTFSATDSKPYLITRFAEQRVERFRSGEIAVIRVNPQRPQRSILKRDDQPEVIH